MLLLLLLESYGALGPLLLSFPSLFLWFIPMMHYEGWWWGLTILIMCVSHDETFHPSLSSLIFTSLFSKINLSWCEGYIHRSILPLLQWFFDEITKICESYCLFFYFATWWRVKISWHNWTVTFTACQQSICAKGSLQPCQPCWLTSMRTMLILLHLRPFQHRIDSLPLILG